MTFCRSPVWEDDLNSLIIPSLENTAVYGFFVFLKNYIHTMFVILVRIFSFKPEYKLSWEKEPEGKLSGNLAIDADEPDAWTIFSIQDGEYVKSGNTFLLSF